MRLGLVQNPDDVYLPESEDAYQQLLNHPRYLALVEEIAAQNMKLKPERCMLALTDLGVQFVHACILPITPGQATPPSE